ncbi:MAG: peptide ABC transporter substrate-binding protein [Dehalococcoidia bacterium]|nr:peptide ABC transporter substrate-binding protein [Dehalococcoidia bacterium]
MTNSKWRMLLSMFAVLAIMAIAVACGDDDDDDDTNGGGGTTPSTQAPSGTITIGATQFETWDPHFSDFAQDISHMVYVWRGLYHLDLNDVPQPAMADGAPKVTDDGKTYTITLKKDLKWSDGQPLTADDFVLGIQRTCNPDNAGHYQYILTNIVGCDDYYAAADADAAKKTELQAAVGVKAIDATTLEIKISEAQPTFPTLLALWPTFPAPSHKLATVDADWPGPLENVYNGPFMPSAYTEKATMELVPNPNWIGGNVGAAKVVLKYVDDAAVLNQAYRTGEVDATVANKPELDKLKTEFANELQLYPATRTIGLEFNMTKAPVDKAEVRLALSQATDRETMMKVVFKDANTSTTNWVPPARNGLKGGEYDDILGFDPAKAKENMSKAGYADGKGFPDLTLIIVDSATNKLLGEFLQAEWKRHLGIELKLEITDSKTRSSRFNSSDFQLVTGGWQEDYPDPENWFLGLWETGGSINKVKVSIKALDDAIDKARYNTNDEERRKLYRDAEKLLLQEANGIAPLYHTLAAMLVKPHIKGMVENKRPGDTFVPGDWYIELWTTSKK